MNDVTGAAADRARPLRYGIEAPYVPAGFAAGSAGCVILAGLANWPGLWLVGAALLGQAVLYLHTTLRGKVRVWEDELDRLSLRGDEQLLDLGCGRGAVLIAAAQRLPTGRAVGVDLWRGQDQSGNDIQVTRANAEHAGVADRVELHTADMTELPFADDSFDVVTSALAIHNIPAAAKRHQALDEATRVLRPGGRLLVADFRHASSYRKHLGAEWPIGPEPARLTLQALLDVLPAFVDSEAAKGVDATYELAVDGGPRVVARCRDGAMSIHDVGSEAVDCRLSGDPVAWLLALYGRAGWEQLLHSQRVTVTDGDAALGAGFKQLLRNP